MVYDPQKVMEQYREQCASCSREELIARRSEWQFNSPQYNAVQSLLDEMDRADSNKKHKEMLRITIIGIIITAAVAVLIASASLLYNYFQSSYRTIPKTETIRGKTELQPSTKDTVLPQTEQTHKAQDKSEIVKR